MSRPGILFLASKVHGVDKLLTDMCQSLSSEWEIEEPPIDVRLLLDSTFLGSLLLVKNKMVEGVCAHACTSARGVLLVPEFSILE